MSSYVLSAERSKYPLRSSAISTDAKSMTICRVSSGRKCRSFLAPLGSLTANLSLGSLSDGSIGRVGSWNVSVILLLLSKSPTGVFRYRGSASGFDNLGLSSKNVIRIKSLSLGELFSEIKCDLQ